VRTLFFLPLAERNPIIITLLYNEVKQFLDKNESFLHQKLFPNIKTAPKVAKVLEI